LFDSRFVELPFFVLHFICHVCANHPRRFIQGYRHIHIATFAICTINNHIPKHNIDSVWVAIEATQADKELHKHW